MQEMAFDGLMNMTEKAAGLRPRPRVALLGEFDVNEIDSYKQMFPTIWIGSSIGELRAQAHVVECDLLVINPSYDGESHYWDWVQSMHVVCFTAGISTLPGPNAKYSVQTHETTKTEEFVLPELPLPIHRRRAADISSISNTKGWTLLALSSYPPFDAKKKEQATQLFLGGAVIRDRHSGLPFAAFYTRVENGLGVAWLPQTIFNRVAWVELLTAIWAQADIARFPEYGDWTKQPDWMVDEEVRLRKEIAALEKQKQDTALQFDREIGRLSSELAAASIAANRGLRQLITAQDAELVNIVAQVFQRMGFGVKFMDMAIGPGLPKREDIRITDSSMENWEAIVEIRGYQKSGGTTADLGRVNRFAELYFKEKGQWPHKRVYVVNGQIEIPSPSQRQEPLASSTEDVELFAEQDGVVISSLDLFRVAKMLTRLDPAEVRKTIRQAKGRWKSNVVTGI
ncbi:MAG: hypothetical protein ACT4QE_04250 [Anaerolineales bacterium]